MTENKLIHSSFLKDYIQEHHHMNAQKAMKLMLDLIDAGKGKNKERLKYDYEHSLYIIRLLFDLHIPLNEHEEDILLTVALCHTLTESYIVDAYDKMRSYEIEHEACDVLEMISGRFTLNEEELKQYYLRLQQNKIALMIVLCDRGSILQHLHEESSWQVRRHIYETKMYYFPMCIYGKENYPELLPCIAILTEKMRSLVELGEMMLNRYEKQEQELIQDIMALREENATIKSIIRRLFESENQGSISNADPGDSRNIAYMKPARSNLNNSDAYKVTDGDSQTYWSGKFYPAYVDVDLMDTYDISEIILDFPKDKAIYYTLYGSNDGKDYKQIYKNHSDEKRAEADVISTTECLYRIIRVYIEYTDTDLGSYLNEIKVHGTKTNTNLAELRKGNFEEITGIKAYSETDYSEPITEAEIIENVYGIVDRTVGSQYRSWFYFKIVPNEKNDNDYFELSDLNGKILITGNEGVSLTTGLNYYYKNYANVQISEQTMQNKMPDNIVLINGVVRRETPVKVRYAYNYCTLSYTFAFFGEEEWQRENDWLALNGANVILDLAGQEAVWIKFLMNYNYSFDEAKDWLVGPGYYAWQYMDNMEQFGGPLPDNYIVDRAELARKTQRWKNSLGIQTVLQGYAGMVPVNFTEYNPDVKVVEQGNWGGFSRPCMIATDSEAYDEMALKFYEAQKFVYGDTGRYYAVDPFHEGGKRPNGLTDETIAREVLESMLQSDANAVWVVQAWQSNPTNALLKGMEEYKDKHCLIVDLIKYPIKSWLNYNKTDYTLPHLENKEFNNTNWAWCLLGNFGGNPTMNAQLEDMVNSIQQAKKESKKMAGIGIISEATYDNPMVYDLIFDLAWADESFNLDDWMNRYLERRYGGVTGNSRLAWKYIKESNYSQGVRLTAELFGLRTGGLPENIGKKNIGYDTAKLQNALQLLLDDFEKFRDSEAYLYDLTEIMRQIVSNYIVMKNNELIDAKNANDLDRFISAKAEFLNAFDILNEAAGTQKDQLGGEWIGKAKDRAEGYDDFSKSAFEMNAKSLITTWGSTEGSLIDYAFRTYEGIFVDLIKTNWVEYLNKEEENLRNDTPIAKKSKSDYIQKYWKWVVGEQNYTRKAKDSPEEVFAVANKVLADCVFTGEMDPNTGNIALGKNVSAAGTRNGESLYVTDGKTDKVFTVSGVGSEIVVELIGVFDISKIQILVDNMTNSAYRIYTSVNNENWELTAEKTVGENKSVFKESAKTGKYVKILNTADAELAFREVRVFGNPSLPDLQQLGELIEAAQKLNISGNSQEKADKFRKTLEAAKKAFGEEASPDTVNEVYWNLYNDCWGEHGAIFPLHLLK